MVDIAPKILSYLATGRPTWLPSDSGSHPGPTEERRGEALALVHGPKPERERHRETERE